jgi:hypothetical protein
MALELTVTVHDTEEGVEYILYKYDDEMLVPDSDFNEHKARAKESWQFTGTAIKTFEITQNIMSNEKVIFRAVKA